jgi:hypothetical protein
MWQHRDQLALQAVITCTGQYRMLLTAVHDAELFDMHWNQHHYADIEVRLPCRTTQDQFEVTVGPVSSGHMHCDNIWSGVWITMGLHLMLHMETWSNINAIWFVKSLQRILNTANCYKTTHILCILHRSFIFTEYTYIVKVDIGEVHEMLR